MVLVVLELDILMMLLLVCRQHLLILLLDVESHLAVCVVSDEFLQSLLVFLLDFPDIESSEPEPAPLDPGAGIRTKRSKIKMHM